jgi:hypothetical protein
LISGPVGTHDHILVLCIVLRVLKLSLLFDERRGVTATGHSPLYRGVTADSHLLSHSLWNSLQSYGAEHTKLKEKESTRKIKHHTINMKHKMETKHVDV